MYNPYNKGRWYRAFIESDGTAITLSDCDLEGATLNGSRLKLGDTFHLIDVKYDINSVSGGSAAGCQWSTYIYADGEQAVNLPGKDLFDYGYVYIFGYKA